MLTVYEIISHIVWCGVPSRGNFLLNLGIIHFWKGFEVLFLNKHVANFCFQRKHVYFTMADMGNVIEEKNIKWIIHTTNIHLCVTNIHLWLYVIQYYK